MIEIGPLIIQSKLIVLIIALAIAYFSVQWRMRLSGIPGEQIKKLLDRIVNGVIIGALVWKFSFLLQDPAILWNRPSGLLTLHGGALGIWLGFIAGILYVWFSLRRQFLSFALALDVMAIGALIIAVPLSLLYWDYGMETTLPWGITLSDPNYHYHPINLYNGLIALLLLVYVWLIPGSRLGNGHAARDTLIGLGAGWLVITFFQKSSPDFILGWDQIILAAMIIVGIVLPYVLRNKIIHS